MAKERYVTETELVEWFRRRMLGTAGYALAAKVILDWAEDWRKDQSRRLWTWFDFGGCQIESYSADIHKSIYYADGRLGVDEYNQQCTIVWRRLSFVTDMLYMQCQLNGNWEKQC